MGVELDQDHRLDGVLQHLPQGAAVAAADDQHPLYLAVRQERHVGDHLVVDVLVRLGKLHDPIEGQGAAQLVALEDHQVLIVGAALGD